MILKKFIFILLLSFYFIKVVSQVNLIITPQSGYLEISFDYPEYSGRPWMAEVIATFIDGEEKYVHPFYFTANGQTWRANVNLPDGNYQVEIAVDGLNIQMEDNRVFIQHGFKRDFIRISTESPQRMKKGSEWFFPAGFNCQWESSKAVYLDLDTSDLNRIADPESPDYAYRSAAALLAQMQKVGVYNYVRFNLSGYSHPMLGTKTFGEFNTEALDNIDKMWRLLDYYGFNGWTVFWHRSGNPDLMLMWNFSNPADYTRFETAWTQSPFNIANGGPISHPREVISNQEMIDYFKAYIRYFVARWGWRSNWFVREMCAEVYLYDHNLPSEGLTVELNQWQQNLFNYFKLIDPYGQIISTGDGMNQKAPWADIHNSHIHPKPPGKAKVHSISGDRNALYAIYNHVKHSQSAYVNLNVKTYTNGSIGYGQKISSDFPNKTTQQFMETRTKWDRHAYWEQLFLGACGVGCSWDYEGALALYKAPALYAPVFRFALANKIPAEDLTAVNNLYVNKSAENYAMALQNDKRTLVYLFDIVNNNFLEYSKDCPLRSGVEVKVPVSFTGDVKVDYYDTDDASLPIASHIHNVSSDPFVTVPLPDFRRAVAVSVTPGIASSTSCISINDKSRFSLYPNPVEDKLQLHFNSPNGKYIHVDILDIQGRILYHQSCTTGWKYGDGIDLSALKKGFYICRLQTKETTESLRFLKH